MRLNLVKKYQMRKMLSFLYAVFLLFNIALGQEKKIYIANHLVECQGSSKIRCMQYRDSANEDWKNFNGSIEGFNYVKGYEYALLVEMIKTENQLADGSPVRYKLKKIISKKATMLLADEDRNLMDTKKWKMIELIKGSDTIKTGNGKAFLQMNLNENKFSGNAGCNNIFGTLTINKNQIGFTGIGTTLMACAGNNTEKEFLEYIGKVDRYERQDFKLLFYQGKKLLMVFELPKQSST